MFKVIIFSPLARCYLTSVEQWAFVKLHFIGQLSLQHWARDEVKTVGNSDSCTIFFRTNNWNCWNNQFSVLFSSSSFVTARVWFVHVKNNKLKTERNHKATKKRVRFILVEEIYLWAVMLTKIRKFMLVLPRRMAFVAWKCTEFIRLRLTIWLCVRLCVLWDIHP